MYKVLSTTPLNKNRETETQRKCYQVTRHGWTLSTYCWWEPHLKNILLYNSSYVPSGKDKTLETVKRSAAARSFPERQEGGLSRWSFWVGDFFQAVKLSARYCHYRFRTLSAYQTHWTLQSERRLYLSVCKYEWMNERMNEPREYRMGFRMWPNSLWRNETTTFKWQGGKVGSKPLLKMKEWSL